MAPKNSFFGEVSATQSLKSPAAAYCPPEVAPKNSFYGAVSAAHSQNYLGGPLHRLHLGGAKRGAARQRWPRRIPLFGAVSAIHSLMAPGRSPTPPTTEKALAASQRWPRRSSRGSSFFGAVSATHSLKLPGRSSTPPTSRGRKRGAAKRGAARQGWGAAAYMYWPATPLGQCGQTTVWQSPGRSSAPRRAKDGPKK